MGLILPSLPGKLWGLCLLLSLGTAVSGFPIVSVSLDGYLLSGFPFMKNCQLMTGFLTGVWLLSLPVLCTNEVESHNNLLFVCPFPSKIWTHMLQKNGVDRPLWFWIGKEIGYVETGLGIPAFFSGRNCRIFQKNETTAETLLLWIEEEVRACMCSWRKVKKSDIGSWLEIGGYLIVSLVLSLGLALLVFKGNVTCCSFLLALFLFCWL